MPTTFTLQTWNLWYGGREVDYGQEKQYAIAAQFPADVLAVQECWGTAGIAPGELTPLATDTLPYAQAALATPVPGAGRVLVWSVHLAAYPYAVYRALQGEGQEVADAEEAERLKQIEQVLAETSRLCTELGDENLPVVVCGDFNTPATGDWAARSDRPDIAWRAPDALVE